MPDNEKDDVSMVRRPPGVPTPPSKEEIDQISKDQALIDDEWGDAPAPQRSNTGPG